MTTYPSAQDATMPLPLQRAVVATGAEVPRRRFRPDIEGMRALAVLAVVAYHAGIPAISGGYVGVDVFFVISGFLITAHLYEELRRTGRISLSRFYSRRLTRLLPASTLVVLGTLAAAWHWMPPLAAKIVSWDALASAAWAMNYRLALQETDYLSAERASSPLQHFWSLAVEEQFYLVWPLLLILSSCAWARRGRPSTAAIVTVLAVVSSVSFALCVWQTGHNLPWAYFGIHTRAWELGAGALIAIAVPWCARLQPVAAASLTWAGLGAVVASTLLYTEATVFPGYAALLPVAGTAAVIAGGCGTPRWGVEAVLRLSPLQEIGRLSYSWYLWHWPVLVIAPHVLGREPSTVVKILLMIGALIPASMSLAAVENRIRFHHIFQVRPRRGLLLGGGLTTTAAVVAALTLQLSTTVTGTGTAADTAALLAATRATPQELTDLISTSSAANLLPRNLTPTLSGAAADLPADGGCNAPLNEPSLNFNIDRGCENRGYSSGTETVVLFGDSHAQQWFDALNEIAQRRKWRVAVFVKGGCTPADALTYKGDTQQPYRECESWRREALDRIAQIRPRAVFMSSLSYPPNPIGTSGDANEAWAKAWLSTAEIIKQAGGTPMIIQDTPYPKTNVPECLSASPGNMQHCNLTPSRTLDAGRRRAIASAAADKGIQLIDPTPWFCTTAVCPAVIGNTLAYRDHSHVSASYSRLLGPVLDGQLR